MNRNLVMPRKNGVTSLRYIFAYVLIIFHYNVLSGHDVFWLLQGEFSVKAFFILTEMVGLVCREDTAMPALYWER